jgi:hypothetical protein
VSVFGESGHFQVKSCILEESTQVYFERLLVTT